MVRQEEVFRVGAFVAAVGAVYVSAAVVLLRRFVARPAASLGRTSFGVLAAAVTGTLCFAYGWLVEPRLVEVTHTRVESPHVPAGHRGVRVVHLSDVHSIAHPLLEDRLPRLVAEERPDLVVFSGDAANTPAGVATFRACITEIARIAPTFCVKGNWDACYFPEVERFAGTGATELDLTSSTISVGGLPVHVVGAGFQASLVGLGPAISPLPQDGPTVVIHHLPYPDIVPKQLAGRVDLMCAGHTHGGQVALPFYGALITFSKFGKRFERGLYRDADGFGFPLYVSRGIGMEGHGSPRVRFCSRPEVAVIDLVPAAGPR
jgi:uncharacterized protein